MIHAREGEPPQQCVIGMQPRAQAAAGKIASLTFRTGEIGISSTSLNGCEDGFCVCLHKNSGGCPSDCPDFLNNQRD